MTLDPSEKLEFKYDDSNLTPLVLQNTTQSTLSFKIKTTSPTHFNIAPCQGTLSPNSQTTVNFSLVRTEEALKKVHKFQVLIVEGEISSADWAKYKEAHKLRSEIVKSESPQKSFNESFYFETSNDTEKDLEEERQRLTKKSSEITQQIDRLKVDIEKANHKLRFSKDLESFMKGEAVQGYSLLHLGISFLVGMCLGYFFLS